MFYFTHKIDNTLYAMSVSVFHHIRASCGDIRSVHMQDLRFVYAFLSTKERTSNIGPALSSVASFIALVPALSQLGNRALVVSYLCFDSSFLACHICFHVLELRRKFLYEIPGGGRRDQSIPRPAIMPPMRGHLAMKP